jgi:WD40 repeat protein
MLASCGADKTIRIWNRRHPDNKWVCRQALESAHDRTVRRYNALWSDLTIRVGFNHDGRFLSAASFDSTASVYEMGENGGLSDFVQPLTAAYDLVSTLEGHENEVKASSWDSAGTKLATCSRDKSVWVWESKFLFGPLLTQKWIQTTNLNAYPFVLVILKM